MKRIMRLGFICLLLAGCDYTASLVENPHLEIDPAVVGLWQRQNADGQPERLLVLPLGGREYLVSFPSESKDALFARACLWRDEGQVLVQLEWLGTAQGKLPQDKRIFQYASYSVQDGSISLRLLNPDVIPRNAASAQDLVNAIRENQDNPKLFRDQMVFQKVKE